MRLGEELVGIAHYLFLDGLGTIVAGRQRQVALRVTTFTLCRPVSEGLPGSVMSSSAMVWHEVITASVNTAYDASRVRVLNMFLIVCDNWRIDILVSCCPFPEKSVSSCRSAIPWRLSLP